MSKATDGKDHIFSTSCILEALDLFSNDSTSSNASNTNYESPRATKKSPGDPRLIFGERSGYVETPVSLKGLTNAIRKQSEGSSESQTSSRFDTSVLATKNIDIEASIKFTAQTSVSELSALLPNFPWLIAHRRVLLPKELILSFDLPTDTKDPSEITFVSGDQLELPTELSGVRQFSAIECTNWHRSSLLAMIGTTFRTLHEDNSLLSETQVSVLATTLLSHSLGYFSGPDKKLHSPNKGRQSNPTQPSTETKAPLPTKTSVVTSIESTVKTSKPKLAPSTKLALTAKTTTNTKPQTTKAKAGTTAVKTTTEVKPSPARAKAGATAAKTTANTKPPTTKAKAGTAAVKTTTEIKPSTAKQATPRSQQEVQDVQPDAVSGYFLFKTTFAKQKQVVSMVPNSTDLCNCLRVLSELGYFLRTNEVLLPCCVAEYKGTDCQQDLAKLAYEMDQMHEINKLVWENPPEPYGIFVYGRTWQIRTLMPIDMTKRKSVVLWAHDVITRADAFYVAAVIYRFGAYLLETFKQLRPDLIKLCKLIEEKLEVKPSNINSEAWAQITDRAYTLMETLGLNRDVSPKTKNNNEPQHTDSIEESLVVDPIQHLFSALRKDGFHDFKLIYDVYETVRGSQPLVIKIKQRSFIEQEADILSKLSGCGAVHMYNSGQIENSDLGYLILECLYPLPSCVNTAQDLQTITRQLMCMIAAIHERNYVHRDIKPGNIMLNKEGVVRLIDFDSAIHKDATDFNTCYGTNAFKPPELNNTHAPHCWTPQAMQIANIQGSDKTDSYSAALMYNIELNELKDIEQVKEWLEEERIAHVATPSAIEMFSWMMHPIPALRLTATLALSHQFLRKFIPVRGVVGQQATLIKKQPGKYLSAMNKENAGPNSITS